MPELLANSTETRNARIECECNDDKENRAEKTAGMDCNRVRSS